MQLDDELCLCFHVTKRKVLNYLRVERPRVPSQLSDCHGAGTGCGWCRTMLEKLWSDAQSDPSLTASNVPLDTETTQDEATASDYARQRAAYIKSGGGTPPPGATPIE